MKDHTHTARNGQSGSYQVPESMKELKELVGDKPAFGYALRGYTIHQQSLIRNQGQEGKRAKLNKVLEALRANPEKAEELGIDLSLLD